MEVVIEEVPGPLSKEIPPAQFRQSLIDQDLNFFFFFGHLVFLGPLLWHMEVPGLGVESGPVATSLHHGHSHAGFKLCLRPTSQLTTTPDPQPTEQGQGSNPHPRGC